MVCGDEPVEGEDVLIAYDGSLPAMRAVQLFTLLNMTSPPRIHLTAIDADKGQSERQLGGALRYLRSHGYEVESNPIGTTLHPAETLRAEVASRKIGTMVMGAYGHRGLLERLFGSTTTQLVENPPCRLFIYH
jgi:nucleotide-binding universal stress UspA family protein